jgi:hypothetical protein
MAMKKIKLQLDTLQVESYETSRDSDDRAGTVHAHSWSRLGDPTCGGISCDYACITYYDDTCRYVCAE